MYAVCHGVDIEFGVVCLVGNICGVSWICTLELVVIYADCAEHEL